jgi:predicted Rossmann fold nucleotide-binding protein DprA/Smf involved in DNA uptake
VGGVVDYLIERGFHIASGGAVGADHYALTQLLERGRADRGVIFGAWDNFRAFPAKVRAHVRHFQAEGGSVVWGFSSGAESASAIKLALLARNARLVDASEGIVAFLTEGSRGTFYTLKRAIEKRKKIVVFPVGCDLPGFQVLQWRPIKCGGIWDGSFKAVYVR